MKKIKQFFKNVKYLFNNDLENPKFIVSGDDLKAILRRDRGKTGNSFVNE